MTIEEIAAALAISRQAVKARLHRARLLMREYLVG
jgi:RNA polymerase sigma-70 factor (ECF subfamily)